MYFIFSIPKTYKTKNSYIVWNLNCIYLLLWRFNINKIWKLRHPMNCLKKKQKEIRTPWIGEKKTHKNEDHYPNNRGRRKKEKKKKRKHIAPSCSKLTFHFNCIITYIKKKILSSLQTCWSHSFFFFGC